MNIPFVAANRFKPGGEVTDVRAYGNGNIHDTFLVSLDFTQTRHFILQRMNTRVFHRPRRVMDNFRILTDHVGKRLEQEASNLGRRWETPALVPDREGADTWIDPHGSCWRAMTFIDAAHSFETIQGSEHAAEVGFGLGTFHRLIHDLPAERLADTIQGFHATPCYLHHYEEVSGKRQGHLSAEIRYGLRFVEERKSWAGVLEEARARGRLRPRPIHGDPKVNNILIDLETGKAVCMIDLDTVMPGLIHTDVGDCLRSCCNPLGEETPRWEVVRFEPELCRTILEGYLSVSRDFFTAGDHDFLYEAIRLIPFELGLRFLTDHLEGDVYFKVRYPEHNLIRALVQFKLTESIESLERDLRAILQELR